MWERFSTAIFSVWHILLIEVSKGLNLAEAAGAATLDIAAASRSHISSNCPSK
jgi:hypothetical protein